MRRDLAPFKGSCRYDDTTTDTLKPEKAAFRTKTRQEESVYETTSCLFKNPFSKLLR